MTVVNGHPSTCPCTHCRWPDWDDWDYPNATTGWLSGNTVVSSGGWRFVLHKCQKCGDTKLLRKRSQLVPCKACEVKK